MPPQLASFANVLITAKPFAAKTLGSVSSTVVRQHYNQQNYTTKNVVTESSILNSFPRPNLQTTLNESPNFYSLQLLKSSNVTQKCTNCSGPHSTDFCPC